MHRSLMSMARNHLVFIVYLLSLLWLFISYMLAALEVSAAFPNSLALLCLLSVTVFCYVLISMLIAKLGVGLHRVASQQVQSPSTNLLLAFGVVLLGSIVVLHFWQIQSVPVLAALLTDDVSIISIIRQLAYTDLPGWMRYASDYAIKAIAPALLVIAYYFHSRWFWPILLVGSFYAVALFFRSAPVLLLMPLLVFLLQQCRWKQALLVTVYLCCLLVFLTAVAAPTVRSGLMKWAPEALVSLLSPSLVDLKSLAAETHSRAKAMGHASNLKREVPQITFNHGGWRSESAIFALYERALFVPGYVMNQWFRYYSQRETREYGCGYRLIAWILRCEFVPVPSKLYAEYYPENIKEGLKGSLNSASFMIDYANFGALGFLLSSMVSAALFVVVWQIYGTHSLALALNATLIFSLMETGLTTAINSGSGWLVTSAIFLLFFRGRTA